MKHLGIRLLTSFLAQFINLDVIYIYVCKVSSMMKTNLRSNIQWHEIQSRFLKSELTVPKYGERPKINHGNNIYFFTLILNIYIYI